MEMTLRARWRRLLALVLLFLAGAWVASNLAVNAAGDYQGASLKLRSSLDSEVVTLYGDGISFDGHYTGALRNEIASNIFTGSIILGNTDPLLAVQHPATANHPIAGLTSVTIGADSNSQLTISGTISDLGAIPLFKEGTGTVVFDAPNTFTGLTTVDRGALRVQNNLALPHKQHGVMAFRNK